MPAITPCEHGLPVSKCKPCRNKKYKSQKMAKYWEDRGGVRKKLSAYECMHGVYPSRECKECRRARQITRLAAYRKLIPVKNMVKPCEHGLPISKCRECRKRQMREYMAYKYATNDSYREGVLRAARAASKESYARGDRKAKLKSCATTFKKVSMAAYRATSHYKQYAKKYYMDNRDKILARNRVHCAKKNYISQKFYTYRKVADKHNIPYSIFYRCKACQRSTSNVNRYCDTHQDVYVSMQQAIELYQLTKQLNKGIHHVRYQD